MKTKQTILSFACAAGIVMLALPFPSTAQNGNRGRNPACCQNTSAEPLSAAEAKSLAFMREEEKLARDVYRQMYVKWNLRIFDNIARSEQNHFDAIGTQLQLHGIADPAASTAPGVFADATLSALYNQLMAKGLASLQDALEVGLIIEKQDIKDLDAAMPVIANTAVKQVYTNLMAGSLNHLEAFDHALEICIALQ